MAPQAVTATQDGTRADLVLQSVGGAKPAVVGILQDALRLPKERIVDAIYRAPSILLCDLAQADAEQLAHMLRGLGLEAETSAPGTTLPRGPLLDIALHLTDPLRAGDVAASLGGFLGIGTPDALRLLLTPPGVVLGNVTAATVDALHAALPPHTTELTAASRDDARFALFAPRLDAWQRATIQNLLPPETQFATDGSLTCLDLSKTQAGRVWRQVAGWDAVQLVNQAFLRFSLILTDAPQDTAQAAALQRLAGVPTEAYAELRRALPCPIAEGVPMDTLAARMQAFTAAGFEVRADLETFATGTLDIRQASNEALRAAEIDTTVPARIAPMPRVLAQIKRAQLRALGAEVYLT